MLMLEACQVFELHPLALTGETGHPRPAHRQRLSHFPASVREHRTMPMPCLATISAESRAKGLDRMELHPSSRRRRGIVGIRNNASPFGTSTAVRLRLSMKPTPAISVSALLQPFRLPVFSALVWMCGSVSAAGTFAQPLMTLLPTWVVLKQTKLTTEELQARLAPESMLVL